jgi:hypothetical protein
MAEQEQPSTNPPDPRQYEPLHGLVGLIDADILAYRCAFVAEKSHYLLEFPNFDSGLLHFDNAKDAKEANTDGAATVWTRRELQPVAFAIQALNTTVDALFTKTRAKSFEMWLSGRENFRYEVAKTQPYKGNRDSVAKPTHWRACRTHLINQFGARETRGIEADDQLGIESTKLRDGSFICTIDKDLDQLAGWHYNWVEDRVYWVSRREADTAFYCQLLSGDSTDNIPGIRGIGEGKARKLLAECKSSLDLFRTCWDIYRTKSGLESGPAWDYMMEQANLVYIQREEGKFWIPPELPEDGQKAA